MTIHIFSKISEQIWMMDGWKYFHHLIFNLSENCIKANQIASTSESNAQTREVAKQCNDTSLRYLHTFARAFKLPTVV